ncbi:hypothetical protein [Microbacterium gubbeenense]|uniref:hypothetical protein n=1 Tax=Microbacterium gubbeenense TaxID=159896 RepID=UPI00048DF0EE|nr:hypothetical protein [Microbacterium gubbeenense]
MTASTSETRQATARYTTMRDSTDPKDLSLHLEGITAIMESHFRYEERQLLEVLKTLALDADSERVLGAL